MEQSKRGVPLNSSPHFDEYNYSHWKAQMMFSLIMQGERVWNSIKNGWGPSLILDAQGRSTRELKPKHEWNNSEANARALFSIFNEFVQISFAG